MPTHEPSRSQNNELHSINDLSGSGIGFDEKITFFATADLGIAMGAGTVVAMESASVTLVKGDLGRIGNALRLQKLELQIHTIVTGSAARLG